MTHHNHFQSRQGEDSDAPSRNDRLKAFDLDNVTAEQPYKTSAGFALAWKAESIALRNYAMLLVGPEKVRHIMQESVYRAYLHASSCPSASEFRRALRTICRDVCMEYWSRKAPVSRGDAVGPNHSRGRSISLQELDILDRVRLVKACLSESDAEFYLRKFDGSTLAELAAFSGLTEEEAQVHSQNIDAKVRACFNQVRKAL
jgi:DNA-directed RNA polymerase specialized sigma24 family protein